MLDKVTSNVLNAINENCKDNSYVIIKSSDINMYLSQKKQLDNESIKETVDYLAEREYIKLKYSDEETYCLTMLPKGRLFSEDRKEQKRRLKKENKRNNIFLLKISLVSGIFAFLGALLANIIIGS